MNLSVEARSDAIHGLRNSPILQEPVETKFDVLQVISFTHGSPRTWSMPLTLVYPTTTEVTSVDKGGVLAQQADIVSHSLNGRAILLEPFTTSIFAKLGVRVKNPESAVSIMVFREGRPVDSMFDSHKRERFTKRFGNVIPRTRRDMFFQGVIAESNEGSHFIPVAFDLVGGRRIGELEEGNILERQRETARYYFNGIPGFYSTPITDLISIGRSINSR